MSASQQASAGPTPGSSSAGLPSPSAASHDGLPACCTEDIRTRLRRGEVPHFGCYDPVYLRPPLHTKPSAASPSPGVAQPQSSSSSFFPPFSSLVQQYSARQDDKANTSTANAGDDDAAQDALDGLGFGRGRAAYSWEHVTSAEDLWNGPPLTTKIPPAADYERILLDRE